MIQMSASRVSTRELRTEGLVLAIAHLATVALLLGVVAHPTTDDWNGCVALAILAVLDLPLSLVPFFLPALELNPAAGFSGWIGRGLIHGVLGTVAYFFLPRLIRSLRWKS